MSKRASGNISRGEGQQLEYAFDEWASQARHELVSPEMVVRFANRGGNRTSTKEGGDQNGQNLRSATYSANNLNQYTSRTVPAAFDILGIATPTAAVSVNGDTNVYRKADCFRKEVSVTNSSAAVWINNTITATAGTNSTSETGAVFVAKTPEQPTYDLDGNTLTDGRWNFVWDGENRLIELQPLTNNPVESKLWLKFSYDQQSRRIQKTVAQWTNNAWSLVLSNRFVYDGWNSLAELNATNNSAIRTYVWGVDISGSEHGAGGVGGLIAVKEASGTTHIAAYDGNGNVIGLVAGNNGSVSAKYEYDAFLKQIRASGTAAEANLLRGSTKYWDQEAEQYYYGYRYLAPRLARWLSRDPRLELSANPRHGKPKPNARLSDDYLSLQNSMVNHIDFLGLDLWVISEKQGLIKHTWIIGDNDDGKTYWMSDFMPKSQNLIGRINCEGQINFSENGEFDPNNLGDNFEIVRRIVASRKNTDYVKDYAKRRSLKKDQPRYDCIANNCNDWAHGLANLANYRKYQEELDKIKNVEDKNKK